jgi:hypothetical protein
VFVGFFCLIFFIYFFSPLPPVFLQFLIYLVAALRYDQIGKRYESPSSSPAFFRDCDRHSRR